MSRTNLTTAQRGVLFVRKLVPSYLCAFAFTYVFTLFFFPNGTEQEQFSFNVLLGVLLGPIFAFEKTNQFYPLVSAAGQASERELDIRVRYFIFEGLVLQCVLVRIFLT